MRSLPVRGAFGVGGGHRPGHTPRAPTGPAAPLRGWRGRAGQCLCDMGPFVACASVCVMVLTVSDSTGPAKRHKGASNMQPPVTAAAPALGIPLQPPSPLKHSPGVGGEVEADHHRHPQAPASRHSSLATRLRTPRRTAQRYCVRSAGHSNPMSMGPASAVPPYRRHASLYRKAVFWDGGRRTAKSISNFSHVSHGLLASVPGQSSTYLDEPTDLTPQHQCVGGGGGRAGTGG